jgi:sulfide:quinone oxidoreductase
VHTEGGQVPADLILFMPGLTGPQWAEASGLTRSAGGFFQADEYCRVVGSERVFVNTLVDSSPNWLTTRTATRLPALKAIGCETKP